MGSGRGEQVGGGGSLTSGQCAGRGECQTVRFLWVTMSKHVFFLEAEEDPIALESEEWHFEKTSLASINES